MGKIISLVNDDMTITNPDIAKESLEISEALCSNKTLQFGSCEATQIILRIRYETVLNSSFMLQIQDGDTTETVGLFHVTEDKPTADKQYRDIKASDNMRIIINKNCIDWYRGLQFPLTLKQFRDLFFEYMSIPQETRTLPNDSMLVEMTVDSTYLSGKQIVNAICEVNGCFGHIDNMGTFTYVFLQDNTPVVIDKYKAPCTYEDFTTQKITKITIRESEGDIGASAGTNGHDYVIENNFLCLGKSTVELQAIAGNILNVVKDISYTPFNVSAPLNACAMGGRIQIETNEKTINSYLLERVTTGIQLQMSNYSANGTERFMQHVNGIAYEIKQLKGKSNELTRDIEHTQLIIRDTEQGLRSEIQQTADGLTVQIEEIQKELDGDIAVYTTEHVPTLENYPAWDFTYNIPCNDTVHVAEDLTWIYIDSYYKKNARSIAFDSTTGVSYRFEKKDGNWTWTVMPDTEYSFLLSQIAELKVEAGEISGRVESLAVEVQNNYMTTIAAQSLIQQSSSQILQTVSADYITKDLANSSFETKVHAQSEIRQLSESINLKVTKGDISSEISQEAGQIKITSNRFVLESTNCTITADGKIKAKNAEFSGKIEASTGKIGDFSIDNGGLRYSEGTGKTTSISRLGIWLFGSVGTDHLIMENDNIELNVNSSSLSKSIKVYNTLNQYASRIMSEEIYTGKLGDNYSSLKPGELELHQTRNDMTLKISAQEMNFLGGLGIQIKGNSILCISGNHNLLRVESNDLRLGSNTSTASMGFFGSSGSMKKTITKLSTTATATQVLAKVNEILDALKAYNLIG